MALINIIANAPAVGLRFLSDVVTVATAISVIATTITMSVVITGVMKSSTGSDNAMIKHTVIVATEPKLAYVRDIQSYERDYYFNATETLFTLVDEINNHLQESFPDHFIKIIVSEFPPKPETNSTETRKRRHDHHGESGEITPSIPETGLTSQTLSVTPNTKWSSPTGSISNGFESTASSTTTRVSRTSISDLLKLTTDTGGTAAVSSQKTTTSTINSDGAYSTTLDSYSGSSTTMFSIVSSLFSVIRTTISNPFIMTTVATTSLHTYHVNNCSISTVNSTKRPSLVYIYGTLYFNVTNTSDVTIKNIVDALNKIFPPIKLIDRCGNTSSANGYFNVTRSFIPPLIETELTEAYLNAKNSIPSDLVAQMNAVTPPSISTESIPEGTTLLTVITATPTVTTKTTTVTVTTIQTVAISTSTSTSISTSTVISMIESTAINPTPEVTTVVLRIESTTKESTIDEATPVTGSVPDIKNSSTVVPTTEAATIILPTEEVTATESTTAEATTTEPVTIILLTAVALTESTIAETTTTIAV